MSSQPVAETRHGVSVGDVFGRSVAIIKANPVATLGVTFMLMGLPQLLLGQLGANAALFGHLRQGAGPLLILYGLVVGLLWLVASGALVQAAIADDRGERADIRDMLRVGVQRALPLFAVYLFFILGVWIGSIFLLVPGIMIAVMWSVSLPAIVAERPGIFGAFGRSRALTKGARWRVFGIMLLAFVIYMLVSVVIGIASVAGYGTFGALAGGAAVQAVPTPSFFDQLLQSVVNTVMLTWFTMVGASTFIALRNWKDGPDIDTLTSIFA